MCSHWTRTPLWEQFYKLTSSLLLTSLTSYKEVHLYLFAPHLIGRLFCFYLLELVDVNDVIKHHCLLMQVIGPGTNVLVDAIYILKE